MVEFLENAFRILVKPEFETPLLERLCINNLTHNTTDQPHIKAAEVID